VPSAARATIALTVALLWPIALVLFISAYLRFHDTLAGLVPPLSLAILVIAAIRSTRPPRTPAGTP
jgi:hypothetical protein